MSNLKVLKVQPWMHWDFEPIDSSEATEIDPIIHRNGYYAKGGKSWFEWKGKAFSCDYDQFNSDLSQLNIRLLRQVELDALNVLRMNKLDTPKSRKMLSDFLFWCELRSVYVNIRKRTMHIFKR